MKTWRCIGGAALAGCASLFGPVAQAQSEADGSAHCVEVEVNGERVPSYACLTQKLRPVETAGRAPADAGLASEAIAQRPSNQLGLFNRAATGHRMGNQFGLSVHPQRPPATLPAMPLLPPSRP